MAKKLVLAEKPSVARDIARVLGCRQKGNGCLEGDQYVVTWALGHLVTLADPEEYDKKFASWQLEDLPIMPEPLRLTVIRQTTGQYKAVCQQLNRKDISEIVVATDAGREGELVARWILEKAKVHKPLRRLWISSVTDKAIKEGFAKLRDGREYETLYQSAVARAEADWLVGINATRALTCQFNAQLSCGRVQTPTLAMIAARENEINRFVPKAFFGVVANGNGLRLTWVDPASHSGRINDRMLAEKIVKDCAGKSATIKRVEKKEKRIAPPQLYNLTELQRDANKRFGFSAKETLSLMQGLYERHKVLTYPRTDSRYLSQDIVGTLPERLRAVGIGEFSASAAALLRAPLRPGKQVVDDGKVTDHHAIIPTEEVVFLNNFSAGEVRIWELVVRRFLAALGEPCITEEMIISAEIAGQGFAAKGQRIVKLGFKAVDSNEAADDESGEGDEYSNNLPILATGDVVKINSVRLSEGQTKPPAPFNEASLLAAMENPSHYMGGEEKSLLKTISETGGLGTVATRADIIEKLFASALIERQGKNILMTSKGRQLLQLAPEGLRTPVLTARWEQKLLAIANGKLKKKDFIDEMRRYAKECVDGIKGNQATYRHDNLTRTRCPECGKMMLEINGKKGKMLVCQDRECKGRVSVARTTNARCPQCHKKLEMRGEGEGKLFFCKCGYRERLSTFMARQETSEGKADKRDVGRFLREQDSKQAEPFNSKMAEALAKLKEKEKK
jgi:DNA topoisomerase-3